MNGEFGALQAIIMAIVISIMPMMIGMAVFPDVKKWYDERKTKRKGSESDTEGLQG